MDVPATGFTLVKVHEALIGDGPYERKRRSVQDAGRAYISNSSYRGRSIGCSCESRCDSVTLLFGRRALVLPDPYYQLYWLNRRVWVDDALSKS